MDTERKMMVLPDGWVIPVTTQKYDFRNPTVLWKDALKRVSAQKPIENLGKNGNVINFFWYTALNNIPFLM